MKNYGFNQKKEIQDSSDDDWKLGAETKKSMVEEACGLVTASFAWARPDKNGIYQQVGGAINHCWCFFQEKLAKYFPDGQLQNLGGEKYNCVANGFNNEIEKQLNYAYDKGLLSDGFVEFLNEYNFFHNDKIRLNNRIPAIGSGTTKGGNSLKAVVQWIHENGIFPQSLDPEDEPMIFDEYYSKELTDEVLAIGQKSLKFITINYVKVVGQNSYVEYAGNFKWKIFDNYKDAFDGDFVKQLAPNYEMLNYGYKLIINETGFTPLDTVKKKDMPKTIKFNSEVHIYKISNANPKKIKRYRSWEKYLEDVNNGWADEFEILNDSLKAGYDIMPGSLILDLFDSLFGNLRGLSNEEINTLNGKK